MAKRVLIAGGYGLIGGLVARQIRTCGHEVELILGGRNPENGEALAAELGDARIVRLDVKEPAAAIAELGSIDLIVSALQDPADQLLDAALRDGAAHIGITKTCDQIAPIVFSTMEARPRAPLVLLGHWQAGVLTLAAMKTAERFARVRSIEAAALYDLRDPVGAMTAQDSEGFFGRALLRRERRWTWVDARSSGRQVKDLDGRSFEATPMGVLDVASLAAVTDADDVRFDVGVGDSLGSRQARAASHDIYVDMTGRLADGPEATVRTLISDPRGQAHLTALGVVIALERVLGLDGRTPPAGGLYGPETLVPPVQAVARLKQFGVQLKIDLQSEGEPATFGHETIGPSR